jgi:long-chain acyl-CoA synthetase
MDRTVLHMLHEGARRFAEVPYLGRKTDGGWTTRSFSEVEADSAAFAAALIGRRFARAQALAILAEGSPNWVIGELGLLRAGCVSVPLSIQLLPEEVLFRLEHSRARALLCSLAQLEKLTPLAGRLRRRRVLVIVLDEEPGTAAAAGALFARLRLRAGKDAVLFADLLAEGRGSFPRMLVRVQKAEAKVGEDDVVTISYTSGTTGNPKGIMLTHRNYAVNCSDAVQMFEVPQGYRTLVILPCDHSFAHTVAIYAALLRGVTLYFADSRGGGLAMVRNIPANLLETNPVFLLTVPALSGNFMKKIQRAIHEKGRAIDGLFQAGLRAGKRLHGDGFRRPPLLTRAAAWPVYRLADALVFRRVRRTFGSGIRFFVGGGALLDVGQQEFFKALGLPVYQGYGLTEAAPVISSNTPKAHKLGSSGRLAPSVRCRIVTDEGREAGVGEKGEIVVQGENVMKGYFRNPRATREALRGGWLYTGDLGYLDADGFLHVIGREKALLIAEDGEKYSPEEIEEAIVNCSPFVSQIMLFNDHCRYTTALVVLDAEKTRETVAATPALARADGLIEAVRQSLADFQSREAYRDRFPPRWLPATFQVLPEPFSLQNRMLNSTLKIVRHRICEAYAEELTYMYGPEGGVPANPRNRDTVRRLFGVK